MRKDASRFAFLLLLVVLSGASALAVEVVVSRVLARTIGSTAWGVALTLSGVLGGMGLGAWLGERWIERSVLSGRKGPFSRPLSAYAACEVAALVLGVAFLTGAKGLQVLLWIPGGEALIFTALLALSAPWGASFPCIVRAAGGDAELAARLRIVYGFNALGGALGALSAGLILVPLQGEWGTILAAAALQITVCAGALALDRGHIPAEASTQGHPAGRAWARAAPGLSIFVFLSGFLVLYWETLWTRILTLTIGSTVHAFSIISASVVLGIGLGSLIWRGKWFERHGGWVLSLASAAIAGAFFFEVPYLPDAYLSAVRFGGTPLMAGALGAGLVVFLPNFLLGSLFPWGTSKLVLKSGRLYALNAIGCIAGAFAGGPLGAQHLGLEWAFGFGALGLVALSFLGILAGGALSRGVVASWVAIFALGVAAFFTVSAISGFAWDWRRLLSGVYQWSPGDLESLPLRESLESREILHIAQGREVIVSAEIERDANTINVRGNGKVEGGMPIDPAQPSLADLPTQILLGELPRALLQGGLNRRVLQIGLGSGTTLGALWSGGRGFPADQIDLIEIEIGFVEALRSVQTLAGAREFVPYDILGAGGGPRPRFHFGDARRIISTELRDARWDAIVSQPSEPWIPGSAPLFTIELFDAASRHLNDGGIFFQWLQLYKLDWEAFRLAVRTFRRVFPIVFVVRPPSTGEVLLLGSMKAIPLERLLDAPLAPSLAYARIEAPVDRLAIFLLGPSGVDALVGLDPALPVNTDSRSELEYLSARGLHSSVDAARETLRRLQEAGGRDPISRYLSPPQRNDRRFLRLLADRNVRLGDFAEALAILAGDESTEAGALRLQIDRERRP